VNYKYESKHEKREEKEKKAQPKTRLNLSIANPTWIPCSLNFSLFLYKTTPKLKKMENGEWNRVGLGLDTCPLKDKHSSQNQKNRKGSRKAVWAVVAPARSILTTKKNPHISTLFSGY